MKPYILNYSEKKSKKNNPYQYSEELQINILNNGEKNNVFFKESTMLTENVEPSDPDNFLNFPELTNNYLRSKPESTIKTDSLEPSDPDNFQV